MYLFLPLRSNSTFAIFISLAKYVLLSKGKRSNFSRPFEFLNANARRNVFIDHRCIP